MTASAITTTTTALADTARGRHPDRMWCGGSGPWTDNPRRLAALAAHEARRAERAQGYTGQAEAAPPASAEEAALRLQELEGAVRAAAADGWGAAAHAGRTVSAGLGGVCV